MKKKWILWLIYGIIIGLLLLFTSCKKNVGGYIKYNYIDTGYIFRLITELPSNNGTDVPGQFKPGYPIIFCYYVHYDSLDTNLPKQYQPINYISTDTFYIYNPVEPDRKEPTPLPIGTPIYRNIIRFKRVN